MFLPFQEFEHLNELPNNQNSNAIKIYNEYILLPFNVDETLLIDDNLTVLRTAREFGIKHLFAITKPNSQKPNQNSEEFEAINSFDEIVF